MIVCGSLAFSLALSCGSFYIFSIADFVAFVCKRVYVCILWMFVPCFLRVHSSYFFSLCSLLVSLVSLLIFLYSVPFLVCRVRPLFLVLGFYFWFLFSNVRSSSSLALSDVCWCHLNCIDLKFDCCGHRIVTIHLCSFFCSFPPLSTLSPLLVADETWRTRKNTNQTKFQSQNVDFPDKTQKKRRMNEIKRVRERSKKDLRLDVRINNSLESIWIELGTLATHQNQ